ncbi:MAG: trigger factor [Saprospiraceae bacterium]|nr:trigger factor [Saprospiraceae bacterium]
MSVVRKDKSTNEAELALTINQADYEPKIKEELKKYQQKAHMRGFRKGKVPMSVIKKMYGKAMLADVINNLIQEKLGGYLESEKLDILGQPLPSKDQKIYDFSIDHSDDFTFLFDVGLSPEFDLTGLDNATFHLPKVIVDDKMIDQEVEAMRKRHGKEVHPEADFNKEDRLVIEAKELEGEAVKKKGFETSFQVLLSDLADETLQEEIKKMKIGSTFRFDIFDLEANRTEEYVKKYFLNLDKEEYDKEIGRRFEGTLADVIRIAPADLEQEFFDQAFGEDKVSSEQEMRDNLKAKIEAFYLRQSEALLFRDFQERLLEQNAIDLPDAFLQRWLIASNDKLNEPQLKREYPEFAKNLIWSLIERKIKDKFELKVEIEEVKESMRKQIRQYFGNYPVTPEILESSVDRMMSNQEQFNKVYEECMSDHIFEAIKNHVTIEEDPVSLDEFEKRIKEAEKANQHQHQHDHDHEEE